MGGGGPAAGTTAGDAITPWLTLLLCAVTPILSSGDWSIPTGEEPGVSPGVPAAGEPLVPAAAEVGLAEPPSLLSSERM
jgi:hypothetical protein